MTVLAESRAVLRARRIDQRHLAARIADRAHELRSCKKAADEAGLPVSAVVAYIDAGLSKYRGLPGNRLPVEKADELREGRKW